MPSQSAPTYFNSDSSSQFTDVFDFTAFVNICFAFTSVVIVLELCTVFCYEVIVLKCR